MLAHQDRRMRIVKEIAGEVRHLLDDLLGNVGMPLRGNQNREAG